MYEVLILSVILFIVWQFYIIKKYSFGYPAIRIKSAISKIYVGKNCIKYGDIKAIRIIDEDMQPSVIERALSKFATYVHLSKIEFYLKNETMFTVKCNSKVMINKIVSELTPFTEVKYEDKDGDIL